ncbi:MerR family transcriptional regulator [Paenibacillus chitinolyticus]|uniref:MerR family transcriptional regulator n=1 Tax=Paenibacillus chitinolyticus TaxID=79263 RepID=UPI00363216B4
MSDTFTIKEISKLSGLSEDTIRYYEKIQLLPPAKRKDNGHRFYSSTDKDIMSLITCMKKTGMSLNEMKPFLSLSQEGDVQLDPDLYNLLQTHKEKIEVQIKGMQIILEFINNKLKKGEGFGKTFYAE